MIDIKTLCPTAEAAVRAMIAGIKAQVLRKDFYINMNSFGNYHTNQNGNGEPHILCYGCAATCTMQEIMHRNFTPPEIVGSTNRAMALDVDPSQLSTFEQAVDGMRRGCIGDILVFYHGASGSLPSFLAMIVNMTASGHKFNLENGSFSHLYESEYSITSEYIQERLNKMLVPFEWLADQFKELNL
jgi:hypothetical protein